MNEKTMERLVSLYADHIDEIPAMESAETAKSVLLALLKPTKGTDGEDTVTHFMTECQTQGFICGFRVAARMYSLLTEAAL